MSNLGRVLAEVVLLADEAARHTVRAADAIDTSQAANFQTKKETGTILLTICAGFNCNGGSRAASSATLRTVILALPQFVLGHVVAQGFIPGLPLGTTTA